VFTGRLATVIQELDALLVNGCTHIQKLHKAEILTVENSATVAWKNNLEFIVLVCA
jgi:hypothetical protein